MSEIATRSPMQDMVATVRSNEFRDQVAVALPGNVTPERFARVAVTAIQQNPEIITASKASILRSLIRCAQDGLLPDGREAALVKFGSDAVYMPMIGGFRKIAAENGWAIDTQVVYQGDTFSYELGLNPTLSHRPPPLDKERGEKIGAYAVCTHEDGRKLVEVMGRAEILKRRDVSKTKNGPLWTKWEAEAFEKTVGRRAFGKIPLSGSERVARVIAAADAEYEGAEPPRMTVDEANVSATLGPMVPPPQEPPEDHAVDEADWTEVEPEVEAEVFPIPESARQS